MFEHYVRGVHGNSTPFTLISFKITVLYSYNRKKVHHINPQQLIDLLCSLYSKEDESSWSKNDSWGGELSFKMPRCKEHCAPFHCNRLCGFVFLLSLAFVVLVCHASQVLLQKWAVCEWRKKLSSGRWHRYPKVWNEINGKIFSLFTCQILAKEINCSLKRVLPEFLCNQIKIQTLSWRPCDFIATHVHPK